MTTLADVPTREEISLLASLTGEWLKLPLSIVRDVGPATQTLGGILKISNRETFVSASKVAERARLPQTREAKECPERVRIGTPIHSASEAVVCAP